MGFPLHSSLSHFYKKGVSLYLYWLAWKKKQKQQQQTTNYQSPCIDLVYTVHSPEVDLLYFIASTSATAERTFQYSRD